MSQHQDLPMDPHGSSALIGAVANPGLLTDTVLHLDGEPVFVPGLTAAAPAVASSDLDEIPAESIERNEALEVAPAASAAEAAPATEHQDGAAETNSLSYLPKSLTTQQDHEIFFPLEGGWNEEGTFLIGQSDTQERTTEALNALPNLDLSATESGRDWVDYMKESINVAPSKDQWRSAADRLGSAWRQSVDSKSGKINMGALSFKNVAEGKVSGEKAVLQVRALTGLGSVIQVPLWHSGFHVTVKAPGDIALINLNQRMMDEKIVIGRTTNGLAFANTSSFMTGWILDFVMDYIYDTSLQVKDKAQIRALIQSPDLPILFWGLACAVWPRGFQYARPYIDPVSKEQKMLKEKLAVGKLLWVDTKSLTEWQIGHMANRSSGVMSVDTVKRYRDLFTISQPRKVKLSEDISVILRVPTANEYVKAGFDWVSEITKTVDEAFEFEPGDNRRANYIVQQGKATSMRQYTHYISEIHAGRAIIEDSETIEKALNDLSADDAIRSAFFNEVQKFIDEKTMALIGTPAAVQEEENTFPKFPHILPMNVEHTFFTLLDQKAIRISQRE